VNPGFRQRLRKHQLLIGTIVTLDAPPVTELLATAGFDWLFIDGEHAPLDFARIQVLLQAAGNRCPCIVRVPGIDEVFVKKALDTGADGVIVPQVRSAAQAKEIVRWCRYPPQGGRSVGVGRAHGYGPRFNDYVARANDEISVILQIEHADAVTAIEKIAAVEGVDALFVGPYDLSGSLGAPGAVTDSRVVKAIERVLDVCRQTNMPAGIFGIDGDAAKPWIAQGFTLIAVGIDTLLLAAAAGDTLAALRD